MRGSVAHESEILAQILSLRDDPVGFVHYAYPWSRPGTPFEKFKGPRTWQMEELEAIGEHVRKQEFAFANGLPLQIWRSSYRSGRGPGKSALMGMVSHWHMSTRLGSTTIVAANTETQMRTKTFPEFAVWFGSAINAHWFVLDAMKISPAEWLVEAMKRPPEEGGRGIDPKYWYVAGQTWSEENPSAFAGTHNPLGLAVMFDEASGIHPEVWNVTEGFFTEENPWRFWMAASQMRTRSGRMFDIHEDAKMGYGWRTRTISTRGMEGVDQALVTDQIRRYGADSDWVRVEIDGLAPLTAEDQFIPRDNVLAAQRNELGQDYGEALILGVDPAPRGKTSWRFRQGRNARNCCGPATHGAWYGKDNVEIAQGVLNLDSKYKPDHLCIDFGMGTGVIDIVKRKRTNGRLHVVKFGDSPHAGKQSEWGNHAIELWAAVRDWLPGGMIEADDGSKGTLSQQLTDRGWRGKLNDNDKKILETKEDLMKRGVKSPDDGDALALTFEINPPRVDRAPRGGSSKVAEGVGESMTD